MVKPVFANLQSIVPDWDRWWVIITLGQNGPGSNDNEGVLPRSPEQEP